MREERVTKSILAWLKEDGWDIICYDFPQSGTGKPLHHNGARGTKNRDMVIPDIVAHRGTSVVFFENKTRYSQSDVDKLVLIKTTGSHSESLEGLLSGYESACIYFGIGLHQTKRNLESGLARATRLDFFVGVNDDRSVVVNADPKNVFYGGSPNRQKPTG
jgi:hypothetical protein